jgi:hypothetical protein
MKPNMNITPPKVVVRWTAPLLRGLDVLLSTLGPDRLFVSLDKVYEGMSDVISSQAISTSIQFLVDSSFTGMLSFDRHTMGY